MTQEEEKDMKRTFELMDTDKNGELSREEIIQGFRKLHDMHLHDDDVDEMFEQIDVDNSGTINYQEFLMGTFNKHKALN